MFLQLLFPRFLLTARFRSSCSHNDSVLLFPPVAILVFPIVAILVSRDVILSTTSGENFLPPWWGELRVPLQQSLTSYFNQCVIILSVKYFNYKTWKLFFFFRFLMFLHCFNFYKFISFSIGPSQSCSRESDFRSVMHLPLQRIFFTRAASTRVFI